MEEAGNKLQNTSGTCFDRRWYACPFCYTWLIRKR